METFSRSKDALGKKAFELIARMKIAIFGVGGVGSWAAEALVRTGATNITIVDFDTIAPSNVNRQSHATEKTIGMKKVNALAARLKEINSKARINAICERFPSPAITLCEFDFIIDAIDSVKDKAELIISARQANIPIVSSMGAALRFDPTKVSVKAFKKIEGDALAKALRREFRLREFYDRSFACAVSSEIPVKRETRASLMTVTAAFGMALASEAINYAVANSDRINSESATRQFGVL